MLLFRLYSYEYTSFHFCASAKCVVFTVIPRRDVLALGWSERQQGFLYLRFCQQKEIPQFNPHLSLH
jgi:hypothetical protein